MGELRLTSTSYAILGQLALRSWTTYELVAEMRRNLHYFWPRAETLIYTEVKRLAEVKLAVAERRYTGKRPSTIYSISPQGQEALEAWLATPPERLLMEFEGLLRVLYAPFGTTADLVASMERVLADANELLSLSHRIQTEYLEGRAPFQDHLHVRAHIFDFLTEHALTVGRWAERVLSEVAQWDELPPDVCHERALAIFRRQTIKSDETS